VPEQVTLAFYYPGWLWSDAGWLKNLLLFFDGIGLLVPSYMRDAPELHDPAMVAGLREHGLLELLEPEELIDRPAAAKLAESFGQLLESGLLKDLKDGDPMTGSISYSRLGYGVAEELIQPILVELRARGFAGEDVDGVAVRIDHRVRAAILTLLAQILRARGAERGLDLVPATDHRRFQQNLTELLDQPSLSSAGHVLSLDTTVVGVDLSSVGIDEILDFRAEHGEEYRAYAKDLRGTVAELALAPDDAARCDLFAERQTELNESASRLARISSRRWEGPVNLMLGVGGAAWTVHSGDPLGLLIGAGGVALGAQRPTEPQASALSYICRAAQL